MKIPKIPTRHHTNPKTYLGLWTKDGFFWVYDPKTQNIFKSDPSNVCVKRNFYAFTDLNDEKNVSVEHFLATEIDSNYSNHVKLFKQQVDLTTNQRHQISHYIATQFVRTEAARESMVNIQEQLAKFMFDTHVRYDKKLSETTKQELIDNVEIKSTKDNILPLRNVVEQPVKLANLIASRHWTVLQAPNNTSFITSDTPVCLFAEDWYGGTTGIGVANIYFPICPSIYLLVSLHYSDTPVIIYRKIGRQVIKQINLLIMNTARRQVIVRDYAHIKRLVKTLQKYQTR